MKIQIKAIEQYFYYAVQGGSTLMSVKESLVCEDSNKSCRTALSHDIVLYAAQGGSSLVYDQSSKNYCMSSAF